MELCVSIVFLYKNYSRQVSGVVCIGIKLLL